MDRIMKMMLLDDNEEMVALITTILELENIDVISANFKTDPVDQIRENKPDIILLDVKLGEYNGISILEEIRSDNNLKDTKVFSTSGYDYSEECLEKGAQGFLQKPYLPSDLLEMIKRFS
jgi:CheY-like chemotaxis protein